MKNKYIAGVLVPLVLAFGSCDWFKPKSESKSSLETLTGRPTYVKKLWPFRTNDDFSVVLETKEFGRIYCESRLAVDRPNDRRSQRRAFGLLQAEEKDGDDENITLEGKSNFSYVFDIKGYEVGGNKGILP